MKNNSTILILLPTLLAMGSLHADMQTLTNSWYVGGAVGQSSLSPEGHGTWDVTDDKDVSSKAYIGTDINQYIGLEAFWNNFGDASIKNGNKKDSINYKAIGANIIYHAPIQLGEIHPFAKLGIAKVKTKSKGVAPVNQVNSYNVFSGIGAEYNMTDNISLRGEYEYFDKDIQQLSIGLNYSPRGRAYPAYARRGISKPTIPAALPNKIPKIRTVPKVIVKAAPPRKAKAASRAAPSKRPDYKKFNRTLSGGSLFASNSSQLNSAGLATLSNLANDIRYSGLQVTNITIIGHTDNVGKAYTNQVLSVERANSVAKFLASNGIPRSVMRTFGRGESQPVASNQTNMGKARNRRVEISIQGTQTIVTQK